MSKKEIQKLDSLLIEIKTTKDLEPLKYWEKIHNINREKPITVNNLRVEIYIKFNYLLRVLETPLSLDMFIPCKKVDGKWVILEEPTIDEKNEFGGAFATIEEQAELYSSIKEYQDAEKRVLFKNCTYKYISHPLDDDSYYLVKDNFHINVWPSWNKSKSIKDLISLDLEVTQNLIDKL